MSRATRILRELNARSIHVWLANEEIRCRPFSLVTDYQREEAKRFRPELIQELEGRNDPFTAEVMDLFDGEIVPENEWGETVPLGPCASENGGAA